MIPNGWSVSSEDLFKKLPEMIAGLIVPMTSADARDNPLGAYRYCWDVNKNTHDSAKQRPLIRLWDKNHDFISCIANERSLSYEYLTQESGQLSLVLRGDTWLSDFITKDRRAIEDLHITVDPNPNNRNWRTRWGGKVTTTTIKKSSDGLHTVELTACEHREHLKHLLVAANSFLPPEIQQPKMAIFVGNARTIISTVLMISIMRNLNPAWAIPTNIFNPGAWLSAVTDTEAISPLAMGLQVAFCDPITDQSRAAVLGSRWNSAAEVFKDVLRDSGCIIKNYVYLKDEDEDSPHTELGPLEPLARPWRNCVVFSVEDKSGTNGPTGTLLDGYLKLATSTLDDGISTVLVDLDEDNDGEPDPIISKMFMTAAQPPVCVFRESEHSRIVESQRTMHGATAKSIVCGGKSSALVNQLQTWSIRYAISQIAQVINTGPVAGGYEQPGAEGLDNCYQGQL